MRPPVRPLIGLPNFLLDEEDTVHGGSAICVGEGRRERTQGFGWMAIRGGDVIGESKFVELSRKKDNCTVRGLESDRALRDRLKQ